MSKWAGRLLGVFLILTMVNPSWAQVSQQSGSPGGAATSGPGKKSYQQYGSGQAVSQPVSEPSSHPASEPSSQPASQPTSQPASQPASQPGSQTTGQPAK